MIDILFTKLQKGTIWKITWPCLLLCSSSCPAGMNSLMPQGIFIFPDWILTKKSIVSLTVYSYRVTYAFQSESTLYSCLNVKELLARSRREIWSLSDCNWSRTNNNLIHKRKLNHLVNWSNLAKWLSVRLWTKWLWVRVQLQSRIVSFTPFCCLGNRFSKKHFLGGNNTFFLSGERVMIEIWWRVLTEEGAMCKNAWVQCIF